MYLQPCPKTYVATVSTRLLWMHTCTARYDDKLNVYEVDGRNVYHLLPTVIEIHFKPGALDMITVSLAAKVISSYQRSGHSR